MLDRNSFLSAEIRDRLQIFSKPYSHKDEDGWIVFPLEKKGILFSVVDGHGGRSVRDKVCTHLGFFFAQEEAKQDIPSALLNTFKQLDAVCSEENEGAMVTAAFFAYQDRSLTFAQLGDTRGVCNCKGETPFFTPDHNVRQNLQEREAAVAQGGVYKDGYIFDSSLLHGLQSARALGDKALGNILNRIPEIQTVFPLSLLLLCTDGFFDPTHSSQEASEGFLKGVIQRLDAGESLQTIAQAISFFQDDATALVFQLSS